jgi:septum formation protein
MTPVTLASKSPTRAGLLTAAGVTFDATSPGVDETAAKESFLTEGMKPRDIADALAEMKAVRVSMKRDGLVIGADQTAELDGRLIDKAETVEEARAQLLSLRGRDHALHSAVVLAHAGQPIWREVKTAKLRARDFSDEFLEGYLKREGPHILGSVGCYRLEGEGAQLFERIDGDYFTILGLPLMGLLDMLRRHGALEI